MSNNFTMNTLILTKKNYDSEKLNEGDGRFFLTLTSLNTWQEKVGTEEKN